MKRRLNSGLSRVSNLPPRRRAVIAAIALLLLAAVVFIVLRDEDDSAEAGAMEDVSVMSGMPGMSGPSDGSVALTPEQARTFGITFGTAEYRTLSHQVRTVGIVTVDERRTAQIAPKIGGFAERLYVNYTGQQVRRGQPVLELYSPELIAAQQELLAAAQIDRAVGGSNVPGVTSSDVDLVRAARRRFALWDISTAQVSEILRTGRPRRTFTIYSPASGVVLEKRVVAGQSVMAGETLFRLADMSQVWIEAELRGADAGLVRVGSGADIEVAGVQGRSWKGRVEYIYPTVDSVARTLRARIVVSNAGQILKPGMYATVRLSSPSRSALTVPSSAVINTGERNLVFVDMGKGMLMPHDVRLGGTAGEYAEILSGLETGQRVVTSAQFLLESESNVGEVMRGMIGQSGSAAMPGMKP